MTVPLHVTESTIFRETWYVEMDMLVLCTHFTFFSVFLKVELSCNGDLPVRILGSYAKPSTYYLVESQSEMKQCDLVMNLFYFFFFFCTYSQFDRLYSQDKRYPLFTSLLKEREMQVI